jgi:hypothetical protein
LESPACSVAVYRKEGFFNQRREGTPARQVVSMSGDSGFTMLMGDFIKALLEAKRS